MNVTTAAAANDAGIETIPVEAQITVYIDEFGAWTCCDDADDHQDRIDAMELSGNTRKIIFKVCAVAPLSADDSVTDLGELQVADQPQIAAGDAPSVEQVG